MFEFPSEFENGAGNLRPPVQGNPPEPLGVLTSTAFGRRFSYQFTADDVLWTARFLVGEAGGRDDSGNRAVLWAMFNRYALFTHRVYPTFQQFLRAYSTPLQPVLKNPGAARRHMDQPTFVRTGGTYPNTTVPRGQLRRHLQLQATSWAQLPASARSLAERALNGQIPNLIGNASEFGSTYVYFHDRYRRYPNQEEWQRFTESYAHQKHWRWIGVVPGLNQRSNAFFVDLRAVNLPRGVVRVTQPRQSELFESAQSKSSCGCNSCGCQSKAPAMRDGSVAAPYSGSQTVATLTREMGTPPLRPRAGTIHRVPPPQPVGTTLYERIPLGEEAPAKAQTGIFLPVGYQPQPQVDLIIYLHGMKAPSGLPTNATIDRYWSPPFPFLLREAVNASGRNVILVAPTLGPASEAGSLTRPGGLDRYVDQVLDVLAKRGPYRGGAQPPRVGNLIIAGHSAGGKVLRALAQRSNRYSANLREIWGFDCLYGRSDAAFWRQWCAAHRAVKFFVYFLNSTASHSKDLQGNGNPRIPPPPNVLVQRSGAGGHNLVPAKHLMNLITAASFLRHRSFSSPIRG